MSDNRARELLGLSENELRLANPGSPDARTVPTLLVALTLAVQALAEAAMLDAEVEVDVPRWVNPALRCGNQRPDRRCFRTILPPEGAVAGDHWHHDLAVIEIGSNVVPTRQYGPDWSALDEPEADTDEFVRSLAEARPDREKD